MIVLGGVGVVSLYKPEGHQIISSISICDPSNLISREVVTQDRALSINNDGDTVPPKTDSDTLLNVIELQESVSGTPSKDITNKRRMAVKRRAAG